MLVVASLLGACEAVPNVLLPLTYGSLDTTWDTSGPERITSSRIWDLQFALER